MRRRNFKLFNTLKRSDIFYFGDKPNRWLIKQDSTHYVAPEGRRSIHPHVAVYEVRPDSSKSTHDKTKG